MELEPRDRNRKTPLDLAAKHGHQDIIKFLESEKRRRNTFLPVFLDIWYNLYYKPCKPTIYFTGPWSLGKVDERADLFYFSWAVFFCGPIPCTSSG